MQPIKLQTRCVPSSSSSRKLLTAKFGAIANFYANINIFYIRISIKAHAMTYRLTNIKGCCCMHCRKINFLSIITKG